MPQTPQHMVLGRGFLFNMTIFPQFYKLYSKKKQWELLFLIFISDPTVIFFSKNLGSKTMKNKFPFWWYIFDISISASNLGSELLQKFPNLSSQNISDTIGIFQKFSSNPDLLYIEHTLNWNSRVFKISTPNYGNNERVVLSYVPNAILPRHFWMHLPNDKLKNNNIDLDYLDLGSESGRDYFAREWNKIIP